MFTVEESIVINKPCLEVWAYMTDPDNVPHYSSNVVDYELVSGEKQEVGRTCRWVVKVAGRRLEMTDEMVEVERGRGGKYISRNAPIPYTLWVHCEDAGGGTKVTWHQEMESLKGFFKFADPVVLKLYARDVRSNLVTAKAIMES